MADRYDYDNMSNHLIAGEEVKCPKCRIGIVKPDPVSTPPDKAHYFKCTNAECDLLVHLDPMVVVD